MTWKKISNDRLMKNHDSGFVIIIPENHNASIPFECPNCGLLMREQTDPENYQSIGCCSRCAMMWAEGYNRDKWLSGWRPDPKIVQEVIKKWK